MDAPQPRPPVVTVPRQRRPGAAPPPAPARLFVASPTGTLAVWVMPATPSVAAQRTRLPAPPAVPVPSRRPAPRRRRTAVVPPGRHARTSLPPGWSLVRDAVLVLLAVAVLVLAVVAVQQPA